MMYAWDSDAWSVGTWIALTLALLLFWGGVVTVVVLLLRRPIASDSGEPRSPQPEEHPQRTVRAQRDRGSRLRGAVVGIVATLVLSGLSVLAIGALGSEVDRDDDGIPFESSCTVPDLSGTVVTVSLSDMGEAAEGQHSRMTSGTTMFLSADHTTAPRGSVSVLAVNGGRLSHELIVLPLAEGQSVGSRPLGSDLKIAETDSVGEASATCGEGAGQGILPGTSGWVTLTLAPGRYELVCNLPGHYAAGMHTEFTVT